MKNKTRWIPTGYVPFIPDVGDYKKDLFEVFVDLEKKSAIFYKGKSAKHLWFNRFHSEEDMKKKILSSISAIMTWEDMKNKNKEIRRAPHSLNIGDILTASWGYDQTNVNFYQVTGIVGNHSVKIREISSRIDHSSTGADYVVAVKDAFLSPCGEHDDTGKEMLKRVGAGNKIKLTSYKCAYLWDGKPTYETALGWGH